MEFKLTDCEYESGKMGSNQSEIRSCLKEEVVGG